MKPDEVDSPQATLSGNPIGVKNAAVRKLKHELGIEGLDPSRFEFITRVHYWASDVDTHGPESPWGEHEIDYILAYQLQPGENLQVKPEPDEVMAVAWLNARELEAAMDDTQRFPLWSPWFKIIARRFFYQNGGIFLDALNKQENAHIKIKKKIALDTEHTQMLMDIATTTAELRGLNKAATNKNLKQGAYGKVFTHKHSLLSQLLQPREVFSALRLKLGPGRLPTKLATVPADGNHGFMEQSDIDFCDDMLGRVSRSFAAVIRQLPQGLALDVCIFYLVLRALDTVEDDMQYYQGKEKEKEDRLRNFATKELEDTECSVNELGEGDEKLLLQQFNKVVRVYKALPQASREVIADVTLKMGNGMANYVSAELAQGTTDIMAYNAYCHAVAGLVGEGLTRLFVANGYENTELEAEGDLKWPFCDAKNPQQNLGLANSMGLFLQKTNIIRDYLEDYVDGRAFWPKSLWRQYANCDELGEFTRPTARGGIDMKIFTQSNIASVVQKGASERSLYCLNALITDALDLAPDALEYLRRIQTPRIYRFCAIPQVMAIATLAECFDNQDLFTGVVKIRKGLAARAILDTARGHDATLIWFHTFASDILNKLPKTRADQKTKQHLEKACRAIISIAKPAIKAKRKSDSILLSIAGISAAVILGIGLKVFLR
eukprot:CAMPEP_0197302274 /NCGR_PEP_ID=MMETSP0890-20130614/50941_1 /TAXON_ID=44058 ORGANISM="Aureoumbra lagunensis, Strain CCMP1510" /NCGR_SAMPLE_ID=MMETSP0890 /ASSEMBLY_ACC=CAM_ASM_000533 /LENGTH=662 /DNA_ID=CAMNT_0042781821 /DNA_START=173 /DNA_END=2163 /DNA_ORIENTATION=-